MTFPGFVYTLCFLTCATCTALLVRAWMRTRTRLLLWTAVSFVFLAINNAIVIFDLLILPEGDLTMPRYGAALAAGIVLIFGFIWETE